FFVMELVDGEPITAYCQRKELSIEQRLQLFSSVCQAIQHAHHKGIIHRDIKPSNVMVAEYDGQPVAKVIDFGVAKAVDQKLSAATLITGIGQIIGTPDYMSPEQARLNANDIDTRSDIYSLGVLLYELLTGTPPFDHKRLRSVDLDQMLKILREEEPQRPSLRLAQLQELTWTDTPTRYAETEEASNDLSGETSPRSDSSKAIMRKDARKVRGELDWIVMNSMDKDRDRRYSTADDLALDIERFLRGEAVSACPPSSFYMVRKFVARNKAAFATYGVVFCTILLAAIGITIQTVRASRAEMKADKEAFEFLIENVLGADGSQSSTSYSPDPNLKLMILLKNAKDQVDERFSGDLELRAKMKGTLARLFNNVGQYQQALGLYQEYYEHLKQTRGHANYDTLRAMRNLVNSYIRASRYRDAAELCDKALGYSRSHLGSEHQLTLTLLEDLAMLYHKQNQHQKAIDTYQEVLAVQREIYGESHQNTLATQSSLATVYQDVDQYD
ncbi:MAG: serine/threonine-protein kinase, partial [Planctomycetota bacterium]